MAETRTRNWVAMLYPESAPNDWQTLLADCCVPAMVSPLHDQDINATGEPKKPHYHIILCFAGVKSREQVATICDKFGAVNPMRCDNIQGYARYLIHKDNPEKAQYNSEDIRCFSGADWSAIMKTSADRYRVIGEIVDFARMNNVRFYDDLLAYCKANNQEWFEIVIDNTLVIKSVCVSIATRTKETDSVRSVDRLSKIPVEFNSAE